MSLMECRDQFAHLQLLKPDYINQMAQLHEQLFEYANFLNETDIASIEIKDKYIVMTSRKAGIKLICKSLDKRMVPFEIRNFNSYEPIDADMILSLLTPDMVFFDIGANIGWYSMNSAKLHPQMTIYAFEPIPQTFAVLQENIAINNFKNIQAFNAGFSTVNEDLTFYFDPQLSGTASARNILESFAATKVMCKVVKLDDYVVSQEIKRLDFIKCDVEGAELLVFKGGIETIKKFQPIIFTEMLRKWSEKFNYHPNEIIELLAAIGYGCYVVKKDKLQKFTLMDQNTQETNFFFLHSVKHAEQLNNFVCELS